MTARVMLRWGLPSTDALDVHFDRITESTTACSVIELNLRPPSQSHR